MSGCGRDCSRYGGEWVAADATVQDTGETSGCGRDCSRYGGKWEAADATVQDTEGNEWLRTRLFKIRGKRAAADATRLFFWSYANQPGALHRGTYDRDVQRKYESKMESPAREKKELSRYIDWTVAARDASRLHWTVARELVVTFYFFLENNKLDDTI